jgi:hypothetical protein
VHRAQVSCASEIGSVGKASSPEIDFRAGGNLGCHEDRPSRHADRLRQVSSMNGQNSASSAPQIDFVGGEAFQY